MQISSWCRLVAWGKQVWNPKHGTGATSHLTGITWLELVIDKHFDEILSRCGELVGLDLLLFHVAS